MSIQSKADWLRGYLESLEYSDSISKRQIQLLKEKLNLLLEEIDNNDFDVALDDNDNNDLNSKKNQNTSSTSSGVPDDLPF